MNRDPGVRKADQTPALTGLGEPRQGTHLSMLRTTHPPPSEGAFLPIYGEVARRARGAPPEGLIGR